MVGFCGVWKLELERPSRKKGVSSTKPTNRRYLVPFKVNRKLGSSATENGELNSVKVNNTFQPKLNLYQVPNKTDGADKPATRRVCWATH